LLSISLTITFDFGGIFPPIISLANGFLVLLELIFQTKNALLFH